ncbi:hypothetical protein BH24ACT5_BH24ACT5_16190 [soil metagenome]
MRAKRPIVAVLLATATAAGGSAVATTEPPTEAFAGAADLVIVNANIITMADGQPRAGAIAIADGKIVALGDEAAVTAFTRADTPTLDLAGATVVPGLVDAHSHFFGDGVSQGIGSGIQDTEILSNGITTTAEFHVTPDLLATMQGYADNGELRVRTSVYLIYTDACGNRQGDWWRSYAPTREPGELLRIGGIKVFADGGACHVPAVSYTYPDGTNGDLYFDADELEAIIREIDAEGHQVAVHALGDRAVATVLEAMERVIGDSGNPLRHRIEHSAVVPPALYGRYEEAGVVAVIFGAFPTCFLTDATSEFLYRAPPEFKSWEWPWRQLIDSNPTTNFAWQVDYPARPASIGANLAGFVTRVEGDCQPIPEMAAGTITVGEALWLMTRGAAWALGRETEVGSLEVGKYADLVVLNQDPTAVDPGELGRTEAIMTMVGGTVEFCRDGHTEVCLAESTTSAPASLAECPVERGDNLALGAVVTASASLDDRPPSAAVDGDPDTGWGAGSGPEQWIEIDLGQERSVTCLRLLVDQFPAGPTVHRVTGGNHPDPGAELAVIDSTTEYGQWLELSGSWTVRYLRITTLASPSWVSWLEIEATS